MKSTHIIALLVLCASGIPTLAVAADSGTLRKTGAEQESYTVYESILAQNTAGAMVAESDKNTRGFSLRVADTDVSVMSVDEVAKELSNPVTALATLYTDFEYRTFQGSLPESGNKLSKVYRFMPSIPIPLSNGKNILMRATIPMVMEKPVWYVNVDDPIWQVDMDYAPFLIRQSPEITPSTGNFGYEHGHLDDIVLELGYGGTSATGFISMIGFTAVFPTSQDQSASTNQFLLGPEFAFGKTADWGLAGAIVKHVTAISGEDRFDTNETTINVFFAYSLGHGWQIISNPTVLYDWEADGGNKLQLPIGGGISKTTRIGRMPFKLAIEVQNFVVSSDRLGPEWLVNFSFTPVIKNPFFD